MIKDVKVYPAYNTKGKPTIKVKIRANDSFFSASVPSGTSKSKYEPVEFQMKDILKVFPKVRANLIGLDESDWVTNDEILAQIDDSENWSNIGGNLVLAISLAVAKASTNGELWRLEGPKNKFHFPYPLGNVIGGGAHGGRTSWQEFLILPHKARDPMEATRINYEVWNVIGEELKKAGLLLGRNMENAWISKLDDLKTLDFLSAIAEDFDVKLGIDFAASSFWTGKVYRYKFLKKDMTPEKQIDAVQHVAETYNIYYLEDSFHEDDFESFAELNRRLKGKLIVGDDIYSTNLQRVLKGIYSKSTNSVLIKPNQIGTLHQVSKLINVMKENNLIPVTSHRSGETSDDWLADLSLVWNAPITKIGNLGPDIPKHNRLIELWHDVPDNEMAKLP